MRKEFVAALGQASIDPLQLPGMPLLKSLERRYNRVPAPKLESGQDCPGKQGVQKLLPTEDTDPAGHDWQPD